MLKENMQARPNIYQVLKEVCVMQNREVPIHDVSIWPWNCTIRRRSHTSDLRGPFYFCIQEPSEANLSSRQAQVRPCGWSSLLSAG